LAAAIQVTATPELERLQPSIDHVLRRFEARLNALSPGEVEAVVAAAANALAPHPVPATGIAAELLNGREFTVEERVANEVELLTRSFARRQELLADSLTAAQIAQFLGTSRQTPHDRVKAGTLLAVLDRGAWRFPVWQFDPGGPDGVIAGLPDVIRALDVSPLEKVSWMTLPNAMLDGETPLTITKSGQVERVVRLARAVGVW
jgi:hypothetical protein